MQKLKIIFITVVFSLIDVFVLQFLALNVIYSIYLFVKLLKDRNLIYLVFTLPLTASLLLGAELNELIKGKMREMNTPQVMMLGYRIVKVDFGDPYYYCRGFNSKEIRFFPNSQKFEEQYD
jgi:hypothetical protein